MTSSRTTVGSVDTERTPRRRLSCVTPRMTRADDRRRPARRYSRKRPARRYSKVPTPTCETTPSSTGAWRRQRCARWNARGRWRGRSRGAPRNPGETRRRSGDGVAARVAARSARDAALALGARLDEMATAGGSIRRGTGVPGEGREVEGGSDGSDGSDGRRTRAATGGGTPARGRRRRRFVASRSATRRTASRSRRRARRRCVLRDARA